MDWVLDPVDDVELVPDIERVRSVGTGKKETEFSFTRCHNLGFALTKANARDVSFRISLRWLIHIINPVDKTKLSCNAPINAPPPGGGVPPEKMVGVCGSLPKILTLFMTKICDIPYPIYDLTKNLKPYYL